ncbi:hypothetical protein BUZ28_01100 [Staphylococcus borealis]|nr:hypothetical protein BUZ28_01100 [Staphylococcus borealis]RIO70464.1 hypothetical protein BUZ17_07460 [Staphylococcus borealis]
MLLKFKPSLHASSMIFYAGPPQPALLVEFLGEFLFAEASDDKNALQSFIFQCLLRRAYINFSVNFYDTFSSAL